MLITFIISTSLIFYAMVGYPLTLILINKIFKPKENKKLDDYEPTISYMIVAHNEESVIKQKLENALLIDYPREKFEILVASDNSTDATNSIVQNFIELHKDLRIRLVITKEHKGKTNAQNEAQKTVSSEILVLTDANSMIEKNAIKELVSYFSDGDIAYVCGKLVYSNAESIQTGKSENTYWNLELTMRDIESKLQTIASGNGALYACRNSDYVDIEPRCCHDAWFPFLFALKNKRSLFNPNAVAYEKAGANNKDEFKRKVRMNRNILDIFIKELHTLNVFKLKWFTLFHFGHRFCRGILWLAHCCAFFASLVSMIQGKTWGKIMTLLQIIWSVIAVLALKFKIKNKLIRMIGYYSMTIFAQLVGVKNCLTGQSKATWEKVESTR